MNLINTLHFSPKVKKASSLLESEGHGKNRIRFAEMEFKGGYENAENKGIFILYR